MKILGRQKSEVLQAIEHIYKVPEAKANRVSSRSWNICCAT